MVNEGKYLIIQGKKISRKNGVDLAGDFSLSENDMFYFKARSRPWCSINAFPH